ncbi:MAG: L,D-transpeptidase [Pseudorhodoplanes sp.]
MTSKHNVQHLSRRLFVAGALAAPMAGLLPRAIAQDGADPSSLKPGQFVWTPERATEGPVVVLVSIPGQWVVVYRGGTRIGMSTCSTGKPGHTTPAGVFVILQKDKDHHSSTYNNASMPYMERLTWQGVALHAGNLPGYPASHGCVRLPLDFAKLLFGVTTLGTPVIVADTAMSTADLRHPGLLISEHTEEMAREAVKSNAAKPHHPETATVQTHEAASFVISTADRRLLAFVNGKEVYTSPVTLRSPEKPFGTHAFTLTGPDSDPRHMQWLAIGLDSKLDSKATSDMILSETLSRVDLPQDAARRVLALMHPGSTMVVTDRPASQDSRSQPGFTVMTHDDA